MWLGLFVVWAGLAHTQQVLVQVPGGSAREYQARLQASSLRPPSQVYMRTRPAAGSRDRLLSAYASAQNAFIQNSLSEAQRGFQEVVRLLPTDDWGPSDREVFLVSYLRLAQLEPSPAQRETWLKQALSVSPVTKIDRSLFPPPLLQQFEQLKRQTPKANPAQALESGDWSRLLINGVSCTPESCGDWPDTGVDVRVTFLSEKWLAQTLHLPLRQVALSKPERIAYVQGECGHPVFHPKAAELGEAKAFWNLDCENAMLGSMDLRLRPLQASAGLELPPPPKEPKKPFYKSKWFWIGTGVLAAAVIAVSHKPVKKTEREPSTTYD